MHAIPSAFLSVCPSVQLRKRSSSRSANRTTQKWIEQTHKRNADSRRLSSSSVRSSAFLTRCVLSHRVEACLARYQGTEAPEASHSFVVQQVTRHIINMAALPQGEDWKRGDEQDICEIPECYCPNCGGGNAVTIMLPTKVPLFREIIVMSLACEVSMSHCCSYMPSKHNSLYC